MFCIRELKGGLEISNVSHKSQSILVSTFLNQFLNSSENDSFLKYYCALRVNPIFNIRELPDNVSYKCPNFLNQIISIVRKIIHIKSFPNIKSVDIYQYVLPESYPIVENNINLNRKKAWPILQFRFMNMYDREVILKHMHNILPTKMRLFQIKLNNSDLCTKCDVQENDLHMFIKCVKIKEISFFFIDMIKYIYMM